MNDHRWHDVLRSIDSAIRHFQASARLFDSGGLGGGGTSAYDKEMALQHAMQAGYTSFETALVRTLTILGEEPPVGSDWHRQLVERSASPLPGLRDAILSKEVALLARDVRRFRHWAMHGYDDEFDPQDARKAIDAARDLGVLLRPMIESFIRATDP